MVNPYMSEEYTVEKIQEEMSWLEFAIDDPSMTPSDVADCNRTITLMREAIDHKSGGHYQAMQAGFEDYEDMIYNRGQY